MVNEEMDPSLVIRRLKQEIRDLREEIKVLQGAEEERGPLTPDEIVRLQQQVRAVGIPTVRVVSGPAGSGNQMRAMVAGVVCIGMAPARALADGALPHVQFQHGTISFTPSLGSYPSWGS